MSRRRFLATSSAAVVAGAVDPAHAAAADPEPRPKLALEGGPKAVPQPAIAPVRWGEPERERLNAMLAQDSLF